jgi:hypothetical protein
MLNMEDLTLSEYQDAGLTSEADYWYRIGSVDDSGNESLSDPLMLHPSAPPAAPSGLSAVTYSGRVELDWDDNIEPDFEHYRLLRRSLPDGEFAEIVPTGVWISQYVDESAVDDEVYEYALQAVDEYGVRSALSPTLEVIAGRSWHPAPIITEGDVGFFHEIAFDSTGEVGIAYYDASTTDLWMARGVPGDWGKVLVDNAGDVGRYCSFDFNSNDQPGMGYHDETQGALKVAWRRGIEWTVEEIDDLNDAGEHVCFRFNEQDYPFISYHNATIKDLFYAEYDGFNWWIDGVDGAMETGVYTSLAFDDENWPLITYYDITNENPRYAWFDGFTWDYENLEFTGSTGQYTSLVMDSSHRLAVSYWHEDLDGLRLTRDKVSEWTREIVDSPGGVQGSLALDQDDNEVLVYLIRIEEGTETVGWMVRVAWRKDGDWRYWTLDEFMTDTPPGETSLAFGPNGEAMATWYRSPDGHLWGAWLE